MNPEIICRACLNPECDEFVPLDDKKNHYAEKVKSLTKVKVISVNQLFAFKISIFVRFHKIPAGQFMCMKCCQDVDEAFNLRERILDAILYFAIIASEQSSSFNGEASEVVSISSQSSDCSECIETLAVDRTRSEASTSKSKVLEEEDHDESSKESSSTGPVFDKPPKRRLRTKRNCKVTWKVKEALEAGKDKDLARPRKPNRNFLAKSTNSNELKHFCCFFCPIQYKTYDKVISHMQTKHKNRIGCFKK